MNCNGAATRASGLPIARVGSIAAASDRSPGLSSCSVGLRELQPHHGALSDLFAVALDRLEAPLRIARTAASSNTSAGLALRTSTSSTVPLGITVNASSTHPSTPRLRAALRIYRVHRARARQRRGRHDSSERARLARGGQIRFGLCDRRFVVACADVSRTRDQLRGPVVCLRGGGLLADIEQSRRQGARKFFNLRARRRGGAQLRRACRARCRPADR